MTFSDSVISIVKQVAFRYGTNIDKAVEVAEEKIRNLPEFAEIQRTLVTEAVRHLVHDARHSANNAMRKDARDYGKPSAAGKVVAGGGKAVGRVAETCYNYRIAGTLLGELVGADLPAIIEAESNIAQGHTFNANLCRKLVPLVGADQKVKDAVKLAKLKTIFLSVTKQTVKERVSA